MMQSKKLWRVVAILGGLLFAYGYWVWPTPWHSWAMQQSIHHGSHTSHATRFFQTNRLDGHIEHCYPGFLGANDCHPMTEAEIQATSGPLTVAQLQEAHQRW